MKKFFLIATCLLMMLTVVAQNTPQDSSTHALTKDEYLKKSKGQKTAAIVLLAGGGALVTVGAILSLNDVYYLDFEDNGNEDVAGALVLVGGVAMLGSIPFFISARKNKERAMQVSFKNELALQIQKGSMFYKSIPSVNLKFTF
jgi:hypothetical protein